MEKFRYWLRGLDQKVSGPLTSEEILRGIRAGRYSGSESIAPEFDPIRWSRLASHAEFYDEFLKRLYHSQYDIPVAQETDPVKHENLQPVDTNPQVVPTELPRTETGIDFPQGHTIHQSEIDALFSHASELSKAAATAAPDAASDNRAMPPLRAHHSRAARFSGLLWIIGIPLLFALYFWGTSQKGERIVGDSMGIHTGTIDEAGGQLRDEYLGMLEESDDLFRLDLFAFLQGAEHILTKAIRYDSKAIDAYSKMALVLSRLYTLAPSDHRLGIGRRIAILLARGRELEPQLTEFYVAEGEVALASGDVSGAKRYAQYARETSPSGFPVEQLQILIDAADGFSEQALEKIRRLSVPRSYRVRLGYLAGNLERRLNRISNARATFLDVLKENPLHVLTYVALGEVFSSQNDLKDARAAFETAARLRLLDAGENTGKAYLRLTEIESALGMALNERALRLAWYYGISQAEVSRVAPLEAKSRESLRAEAEKDAYDAAYFSDQGRVLLSERNFPAASLFFQAAHQAAPQAADPVLKLGIATEAMAGSLPGIRRALSLYRLAIELDPKLIEPLLRLGLIETDRYNFEAGQFLLKQALVLDPESPDVHIALGKHYFKRQDYQGSLEHFLKAKKLAPLNAEIPYHAGMLIVRISKEQLREAMALFYQAYTLDPQNYDALAEWLRLKVVYYEKNFTIKFITALLEKNPRNAHYHWAFGEIYAANNEFNRAIRHYHAALDIDNRLSKVRMSLARALRSIGGVRAAIEEYRLSSKLDVKNGEGYYQASELNIEIKDLSAADRDVSDLLATTPLFPGARRQMSRLAYLKGNRDVAVSEMRKEVDNNPINARYRQELAELLFEYKKYEEAVAELAQITNLPSRTKAPEYTNDKVTAFLWLSRAYRALSRFESAETAIRLAMELDPNSPELLREQGFVFQGQQRDKEAAMAFENYLKRNPAATDAQQIKKLIEQLVIEE